MKYALILLLISQLARTAAAAEWEDLSLNSTRVEQQEAEPVMADANHPDAKWLKATAHRVVRVNGSAGTLLYVNNDDQGVLATAYHVAQSTIEAEVRNKYGQKLDENLGLPSLSNPLNDLKVQLEGKRKKFPDELPSVNASYSIFNADVSAASRLNQSLLRADEDMVLGIVSGQEVSMLQGIGEIVSTPLPEELHLKLVEMNTDIATPMPGEKVLLIGFPGKNAGALSYSIGVVLNENEAIDRAKTSSDPTEANSPFLPEAEFMVDTTTSPGFSGGAAFDGFGRFVGILYRGQAHGEHTFTRVVKASFVLNTKLQRAFEKLSPERKQKLTPFLMKKKAPLRSQVRG